MNDAERTLRARGAVLEGHFLLTSGLHSPLYVEKFELVQHPDITVPLCGRIAERFRGEGVRTVAGPTTGGAILAFETARQLGARAIIAERAEGGGREFRRGFKLEPGERVLVVDDVLTTGGSARETVEAVERAGGVAVGVGVLIDRSWGRAGAGAPLWAALSLDVPAYAPDDCPGCASGLPLTKRGTSSR
jgi:orotate phosphoribosyltransferase